MGDKVAAKRAMREAGVPCVPGPDERPAGRPGRDASASPREIGYPVIIKAAGGGGGRGMRVGRASGRNCSRRSTLTRAEARKRLQESPSVYIEKFLEKPRHVEIQVLGRRPRQRVCGSATATARCSAATRRSIEEAPAPGIDAALIAPRWASAAPKPAGGSAIAAPARSSSSTRTAHFYFIEMNTRIQVEHPVTEMITGIDIVKQQIRIARGEPLSFTQARHRAARATRSNAASMPRIPTSFAPSPGRITRWDVPGGFGVRVDSHAHAGYRVPPYYDSMIGKLIVPRRDARGGDRAHARRAVRDARREAS